MSTLVASAHPSVAGARAARLRESGRLGGALPGGGDPKKGWGNGDASGAQEIHLCAPDASSDVRSLIRNTSSVGDHGRSPLLPMLRDGRSQQIAFAPDAPHQEITADRLCSRCSRISVLMEMREQICSRSILLCRVTPLVGDRVVTLVPALSRQRSARSAPPFLARRRRRKLWPRRPFSSKNGPKSLWR